MSDADRTSYADKIKTTFSWWLSKRKPFILNDEYEIRLLFIDQNHMSAKIQITNLKSNTIETIDVQAETQS